ncbi:MAG: hypothetical protein WCG47_30465 [Dermatophilaceae bacterium]
MHVLLDDSGHILGTAEHRAGSGDAPSATLVARPGQIALLEALAARGISPS